VTPSTLATDEPLRLGIDLGGTKTEIIGLGTGGREVWRRRVGSGRDFTGTVECIAGLVRGAEESLGRVGTVGIGIPGVSVPETGLVKNANSTWLNGQPLEAALTEAMDRPLRLMNDANCFALSEASDGAGAGAGSVFGVILGTGVGGGMVLDGRVVSGANLIGGEWGHNPLPIGGADEFPGPPCYCGRSGCVETWLSGPGMSRDHARVTGEVVSARVITVRAQDGDAAAILTLDRYATRLARALGVVVNIFDPEVIVLGGGVSNTPGLPERVEDGLPAYVFSGAVRTRVVRNVHGDSSGVRGAAWLWSEEEARALM
jgi:fructokinase